MPIMKNLITTFIFCAVLSLGVKAQNTPKPNIPAPQGLAVNSLTGNLFYQRNEQSLRGTGYRVYQTFYYNAAQDTLNYGYGHGWSFYYNSFYKVRKDTVIIQHADARKDVFVLKNGKYLSPAGVFDVLTKNGLVYTLRSKDGQLQVFADTTHKKLTRMEDANGNFISIDYDGGNPSRVKNSTGHSLLLVWENSQLKEAKDEANPEKKYSYTYNKDRDLTGVTDPLGNKKTFVYKGHFLTGISDENGSPVGINYLAGSGRVKQIISCNTEQRFTFLDSLHKTFVTQKGASGSITNGYFFDASGRLIALTDADNNKSEFTYDASNNLLQVRDFAGKTVSYTYDGSGNPLSETDPMGNVVSYTYDAAYNKPLTIKDKLGHVTTFTYDNKGNLKTLSKPGGATESYTYDAAGRKLTATNANGSVTSFQYNGDGDLVKVQYPVGAVQYQYNGSCCDVGSITDANGNTLEMTYDAMGRKKTVKDALGNITSYDYDGVGNITKETDPNGNIKRYGYDGLNRLISVTISAGTWVYDYDGQSNMVKMTDANGHITTYSYNNKKQLVKETDPLGKSVNYQYDVSGNLVMRGDPNGNTVNYQYDALNRMTEKSYPGNTDKYVYDEAGNLVSTYNNNIAYTFNYDEQNRLLRKNITTWGKSIAYTYDAVGNRKTMTDHDGGVSIYTYDSNNRLVTLKNAANLTTQFKYDAGGRIIKQINGNGTYTTYHYDEGGRMDELINWKNSTEKISFFNYTFDKYGNRKTMTDKHGLNTYTYDASHRLTGVVYADGKTETFIIDPTGNRTQRVKDGITTGYTYNSADQVQTAGSSNFVFDANGNTIQQNDTIKRVYKYDGENRLLEVQLEAKNVQYKYDPFGEKIERKDATITKILYDNGNILGELKEDNKTKNIYTTSIGIDSWLSMTSDHGNYFYHKDGVNSTMELTGSDSKMYNEYQYDAYGNLLKASETTANTVLFTGRLYIADVDLYDCRSRLYNTKLGVFLNKDFDKGAVFNPATINRYNYVLNNPVNFNDPDGFYASDSDFAKDFSQTDAHIYRNCKNQNPATEPDADNNLEGWNRSTQFQSAYHQPNRTTGPYWNAFISPFATFRYVKYTKMDGSTESSFEAIWDTKEKRYLNTEEVGGPSYNYVDPSQGYWRHRKFDMLPHDYNPNYKDCPPPKPPGTDDKIPNPPGKKQVIKFPIIVPKDPNEIVGIAGFDSLRRMVSVKQTLPYKIYFENDPEFATAPAQRVTVYAPIDAKINPASLRLSDFGFGNFTFTVPANTSIYTNRLDLRDSLGLYVDVTAGLDAANRRAFWIFESIDPATGLASTLPANKGFLPVNDSLSHKGEGFVNFTVLPSSSARTLDTLSESASIIFDTEEILNTNTWKNVVDAVAPTSKITGSTTLNQDITLTWTATDDTGGSGVRDYALYAAENKGTYQLIKSGITEAKYVYTGSPGIKYSFFVTATDQVGNTEPLKEKADLEVILNDNRTAQTIAFAELNAATYGDADLPFTATVTSGLDIIYSSANTDVAIITAGNKLHIVKAGTVEITASQPGDDVFAPAEDVKRSITIGKKELTVTVANAAKIQGEANPPFSLSYSGFVPGDDESRLIAMPVPSTTASEASGPGTYAITANGAASDNYSFKYIDGTLTIIKPEDPLVFIALPAKLYGDIDFAAGATSGHGEITYTLSGPGVVELLTGNKVHIIKPGTVTITASDGKTTARQQLVIGKAPLTVKADNATKVYGEANPVFTLSYSGFVAGDDAGKLTQPATASTLANELSSAGAYPIIAEGAASEFYSYFYANGTLTIDKKELMVTANNAGKNQGEANPVLTLAYAGFVNGDDATKLTSPAIAETLATQASLPGVYPITVGGAVAANYSFQYVSGTLTVIKAEDPLVFAALPSKVYGDADFELGATSGHGAVTYTLNGAGVTELNGNKIHIIKPGQVTITASDGKTTVEQALVVGKAPLTVKADNATKVYGEANPLFTLSYSGFVAGDDSDKLSQPATVATTVNERSAVGIYPIVAQGATSDWYSFVYVNDTLTVGKKELTVTPHNAIKVQGDPNPVFTLAYTGFVNGDDATMFTAQPVAITSATEASLPGTYPITADGGISANYAFKYVSGILTVEKLVPPLTFAALPAKVYGDADFETGAASGRDIQYSMNVVGVIEVNAGKVHILKAGRVIITAFDGKTAIQQELFIAKATLSVTTAPAERQYGAANPLFVLSYTGFVNGDNETSLNAKPVAVADVDALTPAGAYPVKVSGGVSENYSFVFTDGSIIINKSNQSIAFGPLPVKIYGNPVFNLTGSASSGLAIVYTSSNPDIATVVGANEVRILKAGSVTITAAQAGNGGYNAAVEVGQLLLINKASLSIKADDKTRAYNTANPLLTATFTGFVNNDTSADLDAAPQLTTTATLLSSVEKYTINVNNASSSNYNITYSSGILTINPAERGIVFNALPVKTYGDPDFNLNASVNSNETLSYTSTNTNVATIVGDKAHITGAGETIITAGVIASNSNYRGNTVLTQNLVVNKAKQTITFSEIPLLKRRGNAYTLEVKASSGLPLELTLSDKLVATLNGLSLQPVSIGTARVTAMQRGNANYLAASDVIRDFRVTDESNALVKVRPAVSIDGDGINDFLIIEGIVDFPTNHMVIVNRNGSKVFETDNYDNSTRIFNGKNKNGDSLPQGTYYYVLVYQVNGKAERKAGYFILKY